MTRIKLLGSIVLVLVALALRVQPTYAADQRIADCTFGTLQTDLQAGGDWYYAKGQCSSPITFTSTVSIGRNASLTARGHDITLQGGGTTQLFTVSSGVGFGLTGLTLAGGYVYDAGGAIDNNGNLTIANSTLSNNTAAGGYGGAIDNNGTLTITGSTLSGNSGAGGAIASFGSLTITGSTFSNNSSTGWNGGAIDNYGTLTITGSTLSGNSSSYNGGAIANESGTAAITASSLSGNSSSEDGGGAGGAIWNGSTLTVTSSTLSGNSDHYYGGGGIENDGTLTLANSTLSGNSATYSGGAIDNSGTATITASTLAGNSASSGGAIWNGSTVRIGSSIIAKSSSGGNCSNDYGTIADLGYNLEDDSGASCGFSSGNQDLVGSDPAFVLDSTGNPVLAHNGGPTQTIALQPTSPAVDAIPAGTMVAVNGATSSLCPASGTTTDQRGAPRPDAGERSCDIGAYEYQDPLGLALSLSPTTVQRGSSVTASVTLSNPTPSSQTVTGTFTVTLAGNSAVNITLPFTVTLAAGQTRTKSVTFTVPSTLSTGTYTVTATGTDSAGTATSTASLTVT